MNTFIQIAGIFFAFVNTYYSWQRSKQTAFVWDIVFRNDRTSRLVCRYDATVAWALVAIGQIALYGARA
jgi:hypothetical protein